MRERVARGELQRTRPPPSGSGERPTAAIHRFAIERLRDGDMRHGGGRRCAMPMLLTRRDPDNIPARIYSFGPPCVCTQPMPEVTMSVWPNGWVCHAVRAPGSKVTIAPPMRAGALPLEGMSTRTAPV